MGTTTKQADALEEITDFMEDDFFTIRWHFIKMIEKSLLLNRL